MAQNDIEPIRMMYYTSLLNETLPTSMMTMERLEEMAIRTDDVFGVIHMVLSTELQNAIEAKDAAFVADWKSQIHAAMLKAFDAKWIHTATILNMAPYTRTILYSYNEKDLPRCQPHIEKWFGVINRHLHDSEGGEVMAFTDILPLTLWDISKKYKELRRMQDYRFIIGMGSLTFMHHFSFNDDYSVSEYKYLHQYEATLAQEDYNALIKLTDELAGYIRKHKANDSKVTYVFKELLAMTIRFLYSHETDHIRTIESLNDCINNFSSRFNDLTHVVDYIKSVLQTLRSSTEQAVEHHPHIRKTIRLIETHYMDDLTLDWIADRLNLSDAYLSRLFKEQTGISYKQYLTKYRLNIIKELLRNTDKTIQEIASMTGYQSANQLTRIFRKYEQMTPRGYRQS